MSTTTREYRIRLSAQGKRELTQYLKSIGKDGEKHLKRIEVASRGADKGLHGINRSSRMAAGGLSVLVSQQSGVARLARTLGSTAIASGVVAIGVSSLNAAKTFEASMNRVQGVMGATVAQMEQLEKKARVAGATTIFRASEAASAIEMLAKNGISYQQVMDGALDATLALAGGLGGELAPSADLITDLMMQFGMRAADLPRIVDLVTGAAINSKFGFDDLRLAIGQAGGVAGQFGIDIDEFLTALAATAAGFSSGQDAGTSFKTFLMRLTPQSKEAAGLIKDLGFEFFDAAGNIKSLTEIADELKQGIRGLSEEARNDALRQIFGTDAIRTALLLADQGAEGMKSLAGAINEVSAQDQAAVRLKGLEGALKELASAWEALQLTAADQGGLELAEDTVRRVTDAIRYLNENFEEVNEVIERVSNALVVLLVARGMNLAIAKAAAMGAAYIEVANSLNVAGAAGQSSAAKITRVGTAVRVISSALGGPLGLLTIAATLGALMIDLDRTSDNLDLAASASDRSSDALDRFKEATKEAADEQGRLGDNVSESTRQMLAQSRAKLQDQLKELKEAHRALSDDLAGAGIFDRNNFALAIRRIQGSVPANNPVLENLVKGLKEAAAGERDLAGVLDEMERLAGIGEEAEKFAGKFKEAMESPLVSLSDAKSEMVEFAEMLGGLESELAAVQNANGYIEELAAFDALQQALEDLAEAGEVVRHKQVSTLTDLMRASVDVEVKIRAVEAALEGNWELVNQLSNSEADPFGAVTEGAREEVDRLGISLREQMELYGQGVAAFDRSTSKSRREELTKASEKGILPVIRIAEGTNGSRGYNTTLDYGRWTNGPQNLTGKTLDEIIALQTEMLANPENRKLYGNGRGSSALGAYQITRQTLRDYLMPTLGLSGDELFDEKLQDRMAEQLLRRRHGQGFAGLRNEWEGLRGVPDSILQGAMTSTPLTSVDEGVTEAQTEAREKRLRDQKRERELIDAIVASGEQRAAQLEFESTLVGRSSQEQIRLRFIYERLQEAKENGIDVDAKVAGSSETVREAIERQAAAVAKLTAEEEKRAQKSSTYLANVSEAKGELQNAFEKLRQSPQNIAEAVGDMADYISRKLWNLAFDPVFDRIAARIAGAFEVKGESGGLGFFGSFFGSLFGRRDGGSLEGIPALAVGGSPDRANGRIKGFGSKTQDNILLWGSRDEFMMKGQAVDYYGLDFMNKLNSLKIPKRAEGGGFAAVPASSPGGSTRDSAFINELHVHATVEGDKDPDEQGTRFAEAFAKRLPDLIDERLGIHVRSDGMIGQQFRKK